MTSAIQIFGDVTATARIGLYAFHHAGGSRQSFAGCARHLPPAIGLFRPQLPGRNPDAKRPRDVRDMIPELAEHFLAEARNNMHFRPFAFYGHSLGALVAFELTRALRALDGPLPVGLVVSGRRAPQCALSTTALCHLPDDDLIESLHGLGGLPPTLQANPRLLHQVLPVIRDDLSLSDLYRYQPGDPLPCPIVAIKGEQDPILSAQELASWREQTTVHFRWHQIPGAHFLDEAGNAVLREHVVAALDEWTGKFSSPPNFATRGSSSAPSTGASPCQVSTRAIVM